jgi:hypothetical protein
MKLTTAFGYFITAVTALPVGSDDPPDKISIDKYAVPGVSIVPQYYLPKVFDNDGQLQSVLSNPEGAVLPKSSIPEIQIEKPIVFKDTQRKKIRYGPYRLPPVSENNWQKETSNLGGMADE